MVLKLIRLPCAGSQLHKIMVPGERCFSLGAVGYICSALVIAIPESDTQYSQDTGCGFTSQFGFGAVSVRNEGLNQWCCSSSLLWRPHTNPACAACLAPANGGENQTRAQLFGMLYSRSHIHPGAWIPRFIKQSIDLADCSALSKLVALHRTVTCPFTEITALHHSQCSVISGLGVDTVTCQVVILAYTYADICKYFNFSIKACVNSAAFCFYSRLVFWVLMIKSCQLDHPISLQGLSSCFKTAAGTSSQSFGGRTVNGVLVIKNSWIFSIAMRIQLGKDKIEPDLACCKCFPY